MAASIEARNEFKNFPRFNSNQHPTGPIGWLLSVSVHFFNRASHGTRCAGTAGEGGPHGPHLHDPWVGVPFSWGGPRKLTLAAAGVLNSVRAEFSVQRNLPVLIFA